MNVNLISDEAFRTGTELGERVFEQIPDGSAPYETLRAVALEVLPAARRLFSEIGGNEDHVAKFMTIVFFHLHQRYYKLAMAWKSEQGAKHRKVS